MQGCAHEHLITQQALYFFSKDSFHTSANTLGQSDPQMCLDIFSNVLVPDNMDGYFSSKEALCPKCQCARATDDTTASGDANHIQQSAGITSSNSVGNANYFHLDSEEQENGFHNELELET